MIELFDGYVIIIDAYNYALGKKRLSVTKNGDIEERMDYIAYCTSLKTALEAFNRQLAKEQLRKGTRTLAEALAVVRETEKRLERFITENIPEIERI